MMKNLILFIAFLSLGFLNKAQTSLPCIFTDNMVLQRNTTIPVWGWSSANKKISVTFNKQTKITRTGKDGKWSIKLDPENAGGPYKLVVKGENTIQLSNILVGEVWICSGQSNMEWTVGQSLDAIHEIETANFPDIRHIKIEHEINSIPQTDIKKSAWEVCNSETVADFSAIAYFFGKIIHKELNVPVGLINASWGGTNIETWIDRGSFENSDEFKEMIAGMPKISIDSLRNLNIVIFQKKVEALQNTKIDKAKSNLYKEFSFDDSDWPELNQPELWEQQSIGELDGVVWLRKSIVLSDNDIKKSATIELSRIDDEDITYINGEKIGSTNMWDAERKYRIPSGILKQGKNIIAIRIVDTGGGGGIYGDSENLKLILDDQIIPLNGNWKFQVESIMDEVGVNEYPSLAFNAMINPIIPFAFKGVLWYQGESNAGRAYQYREAFPLLINAWRQKWNIGDFPFYFVQLATFKTSGNSNEGCDWAELREAQAMALNLANTGMCITTDVGDPADIHPINKQEVGKRLSALALNNVYGKKQVCMGPIYRSMEISNHQIVISFENIGTGLFTTEKSGNLSGFEIAGADQVFYPAKAFIDKNKVVLSNEKVKNPVAARFGWIGDASACNLFNMEGFPASPFRTDDWKTITKGVKYILP